MSIEITKRIEAWYADRCPREFDSLLYGNQLSRHFYEEWETPRSLQIEFGILGILFFTSIGNLWKLNTPPNEYEDSIDRIFLHSDSGPFGKRQPVEMAIEWIILKILSEEDECQVKKFSLVLLDAILDLFAVNCKRSQTEAILSAICDYMDRQPKGELYPDDEIDWHGDTELYDSLNEIARTSGVRQFRVKEPSILEEIPEKIQR